MPPLRGRYRTSFQAGRFDLIRFLAGMQSRLPILFVVFTKLGVTYTIMIRKNVLPTLYFAFCAILGGVLLPALGDVGPLLLLAALGILIGCVFSLAIGQAHRPTLLYFFAPIWGALLLVSLLHGGLHIVPLVFNLSAAAVFFVAAKLGTERVRQSLYWAGWVWLLTLPFLFFTKFYLPDRPDILMDRNIVGFWGLTFTVAALASQKKWYHALPFVAVAVFSGSRGGLIGLAAAVLIFYRPRVPAKQMAAWAALGILAVFGLMAMRTHSVMTRLPIYQQAVNIFLDHPVAGIGVNGIFEDLAIKAVGFAYGEFYIPSPEQEYVRTHIRKHPPRITHNPHAHNGLLNYAAETGLIGLAGLGLGLWWLYQNRAAIRWDRWQWAMIGGTLAHSLVDWPLWYYGPLVVFMAVAGTVEKNDHP